ncbi:MAG: MBL fold hydrolase, partial [Candidatus Diapherotrites archaeon CG08_land_8_20_14_0_20_34_12]
MVKLKITFYGASKEVGRSCLLVDYGSRKFLMDAGINLGAEGENRFPKIPLNLIPKINSIFLSHAHLDHSGYLPF